jgi:hypothetical protein
LTDLSQISLRSDGDSMALMQLDADYLRNWSIKLDLYILCATIPALIRETGALADDFSAYQRGTQLGHDPRAHFRVH